MTRVTEVFRPLISKFNQLAPAPGEGTIEWAFTTLGAPEVAGKMYRDPDDGTDRFLSLDTAGSPASGSFDLSGSGLDLSRLVELAGAGATRTVADDRIHSTHDRHEAQIFRVMLVYEPTTPKTLCLLACVRVVTWRRATTRRRTA